MAKHFCGSHLDRDQGARSSANYTRYDYTAWGEPTEAMASPRMHAGLAPRQRLSSPSTARRPVYLFPRFVTSWKTTNFAPTEITAHGLDRIQTPSCRPFCTPSRKLTQFCLQLRSVRTFPTKVAGLGLTLSRTGFYASLGGYLGLTIGWVEGLEIKLLWRGARLRRATTGAQVSRGRSYRHDRGRLGLSQTATAGIRRSDAMGVSHYPTRSDLLSERPLRAGLSPEFGFLILSGHQND